VPAGGNNNTTTKTDRCPGLQNFTLTTTGICFKIIQYETQNYCRVNAPFTQAYNNNNNK
jgi:hypothetical protein